MKNTIPHHLLSKIQINEIEPDDNQALAIIIRNCLTEFGANVPGTVYFDPTTDALFELFQTRRSVYFVAKLDGKILGGSGIFPTEGLPVDTCELVKMYLLPEARGIGLGRKLIEISLGWASANGFNNVYLETLPELRLAVNVYEKFGFKYLKEPIGQSKHFGCGIWMLKNLV
jgi:putative acetyltransferase